MSHSLESKALSGVLTRDISHQYLTLRLLACVAVSLALSAVWIYALANHADRTSNVARPVATPRVSPIKSVTSEPIAAIVANEPNNPSHTSIVSQGQYDEFNELARKWDTNEWHATPCWTAESPFGVWGAMGIRSGSDAAIERPED